MRLLFLLLLTPFLFAFSSTAESSATWGLDPEEVRFVEILNDYRVTNGRAPLEVTVKITRANDWHSRDMGEKSYFSHIDSLGRSPWDRMCDFGYCHNTWKGENIAAGFTTAEAVFEAWKNSPSHNANMLQGAYTVIGVARVAVPGSAYGIYWATGFGGFDPEQPAPNPQCPDFNEDGIVNTIDVGHYVTRLNVREGEPGYAEVYDLNANGILNTLDVGKFVVILNSRC